MSFGVFSGNVKAIDFKEVLTSVLVGAILLSCSAVYVYPSFTPAFHGAWYENMSQHPFDFGANAPFQFRILTPLIGYCLHVSESNFVFIPLVFSQLLLVVIFFYYRKKGYLVSEAVMMTALISFSSVNLIPLIAPGYTDSVSYFLIFLAFATILNSSMSAFFFAAALFNHEANVVLFPALCAYSYRENNKSQRILAQYASTLLILIGVYFTFRYFAGKRIEPAYDLEYYLNPLNIIRNVRLVARLTPLGAFFAFKLFWIIPITYLWVTCKKGINRLKLIEILPVLLILISTGIQLLIAYDITRLFSLAFMAILLSAEKLKTMVSRPAFTQLALTLIVLNFLIPQYFVGQEGAHRMLPMWYINDTK